MLPGLIAGGAGLGLAGSLASAYGQSQAAKEMSGVKRHQIDDNERLNQEYLAKVRASLLQNSPANTLGATYAAPNAAAQAEIAKIGAATGSTGNAGAGQTSALNQASQNADIQNRLASLSKAQDSEQQRASQIENDRQEADQRAQLLNELYGSQMQIAAQKGRGFRTAGGLLGLGGAGLNLAGMYGNPTVTSQTWANAPSSPVYNISSPYQAV